MNFVIDFLKQLLELVRISVSGKPIDARTTETVDAYKWFIDKLSDKNQKEVQYHSDPYFHPGKIYIFKYDPKFKDKYDYYDRHPIVLALGKMPAAEGGYINVGINISWYPPAARNYIINKIRDFYKSRYDAEIQRYPGDSVKQRPILMDLYALKVALDQYGLSFAIRSYLPSRVKNPKVCISYENWDKAIKLDQPRIFPELKGSVSLAQIYKDYRDYVKYCQANRSELRKKLDESRKLNRYKFIK